MDTTRNHPYRRHRLRKDGRGAQGMVEFALALPVLLLLIFGVIEFARVFQAWLSVENGARFGVRYAVTGEFNPVYCAAAGAATGNSAADAADGQIDCRVPATVEDYEEIEGILVDWARIPSIRDAADQGSMAIQKDRFATQGNVRFFKITQCSSRDANEDAIQDFGFTPANQATFTPASCSPRDDAGAPGDRVTVVVDFNHPLILPFISNLWPQAHLTARRDGVVERFRTSRVINLPMDIALPTFTSTPTGTATETATSTATLLPTDTATSTATPDCTLYRINPFTLGPNGEVYTSLTNSAPDDPTITQFDYMWDYAEDYGELRGYNSLRTDWLRVGSTIYWGNNTNGASPNDYDSHTDTSFDGAGSWAGPIPFSSGSTLSWTSDMDGDWGSTWSTDLLGTDFGLTMYLNNGCVVTLPPIPRALPLPNCELYTVSDFSNQNGGRIETFVTNGDQYDAQVSRIILNWSYLENLLAAAGDTTVNTDWMQWRYANAWGEGNGGARDTDSVTDTGADSAATWAGSQPFGHGTSNSLLIDMDKSDESISDWLDIYGIRSSDFGIRIEFDNGCILERPPVTRPIVTPTPDCSLVFAESSGLVSDDFQIRVRNNNVAQAYLINSTLVWPTNWGMYFNYMQFDGFTYYDVDRNNSPVSVAVSPGRPFPGMTSKLWLSDFNNFPANPPAGYFSGRLVFNFPNWGNCEVFRELYVTPTRTATATGVPTATRPVTATATRTRTPTVEIKPTDTRTPTSVPSRTPTRTSVVVTPSRTSTVPGPTPTRTTQPTRTNTPTVTPTFNMDG